MTPSRRFSLMAVAGMLITFVAVMLPTTGRPAGAASSCAGVTVVVDFTHFNGNIERGCAPNPSNGLDALHQAGFTTAGTSQYGDAFVCRIDNLPGAAQESCTSTPPATEYWAYYHARANDSSWTYSPIGASNTHPAAGTVEGYAFGARALPGVAPRDVALPPPPPSTTPAGPTPTTSASSPAGTTPPAILPSGGGGTPQVHGGGATGPSGGMSPTSTKRNAQRDTKASDTTSKDAKRSPHATTSTTKHQAPAVVDRSRVASAPTSGPSSGSPIGVIVTVVLLALGATAAFFIVRARRLRVLEP